MSHKELFEKLVSKAEILNNSKRSLKYLKLATRLLYAYNWVYNDQRINRILNLIAKREICNSLEKYESDSDSVVFIDSISMDNRGLTQQYLSAIVNCNLKLCYITSRSAEDNANEGILSYLRASNQTIIKIPACLGIIETSIFLRDTIVRNRASKVFLHIRPDSIAEVMTLYALPPSIKKYQINLTNHAYWLGADIIDYSFEFNEYGYRVSEKRRNIPIEKLIYLPFYPITNDSSIDSLPDLGDSLVLLSGGVMYKITDNDNTFASFISSTLDKYPNTIFLWAGGGNLGYIREQLEKYIISKRAFLIGPRKDINHVFAKSDIYINTYPVGGGLMCQLAAHHNLPIVSLFLDNDEFCRAENTVCQLKQLDISSSSILDAHKRIEKLISDKDYRLEQGTVTNSAVITKDKFDMEFQNAITIDRTNIDRIDCNKEININREVTIMNANEVNRIIVKELRFEAIVMYPKAVIDCIKYIFDYHR